MFYVEQVFFDNGPVRVTVYSEKVTNGLIFRDYKEATPEKPLMKELPGRMIYVDACPPCWPHWPGQHSWARKTGCSSGWRRMCGRRPPLPEQREVRNPDGKSEDSAHE